jgi:thiamine pyrophosphokinase
MDQTLASIHVLLKLSPKSQTVSIILIDKHNLMMYIKAGHSVIYPSKTIESTRATSSNPRKELEELVQALQNQEYRTQKEK